MRVTTFLVASVAGWLTACGQPIDTDEPIDTGPVCEAADVAEPVGRTRPMAPIGPIELLWPGANAPLADPDFVCEEPVACDELPTDCEGNTPPLLGAPVIVIDGEILEAVPKEEHTYIRDLPAETPMSIGIPYVDFDDNLGCGTLAYRGRFDESLGWPDGYHTVPLCANQPCSSAESGLVVAAGRTSTGDPGPTFTMTLIDRCGAASETIRVEYGYRSDWFYWSTFPYEPENYE